MIYNKIRLQQIGWRNAIKASELKVGDIMICNFGETQKVTDITPTKSGKMLNYTVLCKDGKLYNTRTSRDRLFAVQRVNYV